MLDEMEKVADGSDRRNKPQGGGQMTPTERERVKPHCGPTANGTA